MQPVIDTRAGLGDLLERVLDRGVILRLDLILGVAGIPLIGLSLHAAVASIETMIGYGMFRDWDAASRAEATRTSTASRAVFETGEHVLLEQFAMLRCETGVLRTWRPGRAYLTDRRLVFVRPSPHEVLTSLALPDITGIAAYSHPDGGSEADVLCLADTDGSLLLLRATDSRMLQTLLRNQLQRQEIDVVEFDPVRIRRATGPEIRAESRLWYADAAAGTWRPGWGTLSDTTFTFWSDFERRSVVHTPLTRVRAVGTEVRHLGAALGEGEVLCLTTDVGREWCFIGDETADWPVAIRRAQADLVRPPDGVGGAHD